MNTFVALSCVNIAMFVCAAIGACITMRSVKFAPSLLIRNTSIVFLIATVIMSTWFIIAQTKWIIFDHNTAVGDASAVAWLLYDYAKAIHTLAAIGILYSYLGWYKGRLKGIS